MAIDLKTLLRFCVDNNGSDLFIYSDTKPNIKINGKCKAISTDPLSSKEATNIIYSMLSESQITQYEENLELNTGITVEGVGRFRVNVFRERGQTAMVARLVGNKIPSIDELHLPEVLKKIILEERGMVLVVGATGMGKSTTLASMIKHRSEKRHGHIICVEDPIEYLHQHNKSLIGQREIGIDTYSWHNALKSAMRESPDTIMIGEVLDSEAMSSALKFADTGHLCLTTLHAVNANQAIDRMINFYPGEMHPHVRQDLSLNLKAIISMRLPPGKNGGRIPIVEVMLNSPQIRDLIQKGHTSGLKEAMMDDVEDGSQTFDHALLTAVEKDLLDPDEALLWADSPNDLKLKIRFGGSDDVFGEV